ncbi:MAG: glycosyltransferase family 1 protein [Bacteroidetes bacterium]|nr:MAG: glycosyltransferase family 1 protein [Bacteroidota bacterium]
MKGSLYLYFITPPERDRWIFGDRFVRSFIRRIIKGKRRQGGVEKVFINLCKGLNQIKQPYIVNLPFVQLQPKDIVCILGSGIHCLDGYNNPNKIVAGIGLMTHPSEWPNLCNEYPVMKYLQHSEWANSIYKPFYGDKCEIWPVGIDTEKWLPNYKIEKKLDFIIYNKVHWEYEAKEKELLQPIRNHLLSKNLNFVEIKYGYYHSNDFKRLLDCSKAMIFLSEHESQGIAYQEALSTNVPIFAWDQGKLLDPNYKIWGDENKPTSSVPYFDEKCGLRFRDLSEFESKFELFFSKVQNHEFKPREYILENLTLEKSALRFLEIVKSVEDQ